MLRCTALIRRLQLITWSRPMPSLQKRSAHLAVPSQVTQSNRVHEVMISRRLTASERRHRVRMRKCCQLSPVTLLQPPTGVENKELLPELHITCEEREETHLLFTTVISNQIKRMAYRGSVKPFVHFNAKHDAEILHRAMKGIGTDEDAILMLLSGRNNDQRQQIKAVYKKAYGKDLVSALKSELGGLFESLIVALMTPPSSYDASQLHKALKGAGTDDDVLIEILASRTGEQIKDIVKVYKKEFNGKLEKDICGDTSGHYQKLLVILLQGSREEGVDEEKIEKDAKELYAAGEGKFGTDEEKFITILGNRSAEHLRKVFDAYNTLSGSDIEDSIEGETTGNLENLLLAVVKCARSVPEFFAEVLYKSMRRAGTDDGTLMRIMVSRSEVDMLDIRACFKKKYKASLYTTIQEDTDGDYQKALLYLCGGND